VNIQRNKNNLKTYVGKIIINLKNCQLIVKVVDLRKVAKNDLAKNRRVTDANLVPQLETMVNF